MKVAGTRPSDLVAIFGVGGLGHLALQYAAIAGGRVVAVDVLDVSERRGDAKAARVLYDDLQNDKE